MDIKDYLKKAVEVKASDIHVCVGLPVVLRKHGELLYMDDNFLTVDDCYSIVQQCVDEGEMKILERDGEVDFAYALPSVARFRVNAFRQRGSYALAFRVISTGIPTIKQLQLPEVLYDLADKPRGLVLITGPTGSGKSTTLAAMIDYINSTKRCHIVTIEDPIEYLHKHKQCVINQRELGSDTMSFTNALRAALREDPDVILVGEMRDIDTISVALTAAETGHLVLSTLHTLGAAKTVDRIIDVFMPYQQAQVRSQLSTVLQGIVSQQLVRRADNSGRIAATEIMLITPAISNMIREARTVQINSSIHTGSDFGMHSMDASLAQLYKDRIITLETAKEHAVDPAALNKLVTIG